MADLTEEPCWLQGCRILEFLPANVGLTRAEIAARLGEDVLPCALEYLEYEELAEARRKRRDDPDPRWSFRPEMREEFAVVTSQGFWDLAREAKPLTVLELAGSTGALEWWVLRAMWRTARRGWTEEDLSTPWGGSRVHSVTRFGMEVYRANLLISKALPYRDTGKSMNLAEAMAAGKCGEKAALAALEFETLGETVAEEVAGEGGERRWWSTVDWNEEFEKVETWDRKRAKDVN